MNPTIAIDSEQRKLFIAFTIPTLAHQTVTVTQHLHPEQDGRDACDVECEGCGLSLTYHAAAYAELALGEERDWAAYRDAADHAATHSRVCGGTTAAAPLTVPLTVQAAAALLFSSEVPIKALNGADLHDAIAAEFARRGCDLSRAVGDVAFEYGKHPETAAAHMHDCVSAASRLMGVSL